MRPYTPPTRMARRGEQCSPCVVSDTRSESIFSHLLMHYVHKFHAACHGFHELREILSWLCLCRDPHGRPDLFDRWQKNVFQHLNRLMHGGPDLVVLLPREMLS